MGMTIEDFLTYAKGHNMVCMTKELYEQRLSEDIRAVMKNLQLEIEELDPGVGWEGYVKKEDLNRLIQDEIDSDWRGE